MSDIKTHWSGFLNALGKSSTPIGSNSIPFQNTSTKIGVSGFLDLKPTETKIQPNYDAMSSSWLGVEASTNGFLKQKVVSTDFMNYK